MHESGKWKWSCSVVSNSSQPHGLQPTRLLRPWDFPGKSTGVGCHCLLGLPSLLVPQFKLLCFLTWMSALPVSNFVPTVCFPHRSHPQSDLAPPLSKPSMALQLPRGKATSSPSHESLSDVVTYHSPVLHFYSASPASPLLLESPLGLCTYCSLLLESSSVRCPHGHSLSSFRVCSNISSLEIHYHPFKNDKPMSPQIIVWHCPYLLSVCPDQNINSMKVETLPTFVHCYTLSPQNGTW